MKNPKFLAKAVTVCALNILQNLLLFSKSNFNGRFVCLLGKNAHVETNSVSKSIKKKLWATSL